MNLETCIWNQTTYQVFQEELYQLQDLNYQKFHGKLIQDTSSLIGIRTPILKKIAKKISKNHPEEFLKCIKHTTYEETLIHGLLLGYMKLELKDLVIQLNNFFPYMNNWALNDITCANLKIWKKYLKEGIPYIQSYFNQTNPWIQRFGLTLLINYYINDEYIDFVLDSIKNISGNNYYVGMANAWLISVCYVHYPDKILKFLKKKELDEFTRKHAIQKIIESNRVSMEEKNIVRHI